MQITCDVRLLLQEIPLLVRVLSSVVQLVFCRGLGQASSGAGPDLGQLLEVPVKPLSSSSELRDTRIATVLIFTDRLRK